MKEKEIIEKLKEEHPKGRLELIYIDYRDNLSPEQVETIAQGDMDKWYEESMEWQGDAQYESIDWIIDNVFEDAQDLIDEEREIIRDWCFDHDYSDPLKDLLKNTRDMLYYDTGAEVGSMDYGDTKEDIRKSIYRVLDIQKLSKDNREKLEDMILNSYYGGILTILLSNNDLEQLLKIGEKENCLRVNDPVVCVMNRFNGSGDFTQLEGIEIQIPFTRENLHSDNGNNGYSIQEVFGCNGDIGSETWSTGLRYDFPVAKINEKEQARKEREERYKETYKEGGCTFGDMNIKRHRSVVYRNNYPCGNKCEDCGTFWID